MPKEDRREFAMPALPSMPPMAKQKTEWASILMGTWMAFISSAHFSLYFTSLWPFLKTLDPNVTEAFFGSIVAAYSLAQIIASPLLGIWANRIERIRPPLLLCNCLMFCGNWLYFLVELFPVGMQKGIIMGARFITGTGSSQISLLRAHASAASTINDRSRATALVTGGVAIGLSLGPTFQIFFSWLDYPGIHLGPQLHLSMFNSPALFGSFLNVINIIFLCTIFREGSAGILVRRQRKNKHQNHEKCSSPPSPTASTDFQQQPKLPPPDQMALCLCYLLRFTQQFIITNLETIGSSFAMLMFLWGSHQVVVYEALAHSARGFVALVVYIVYIAFDLGKIVNDRLVCLVSLGGLLLFHIFTFSWPFLPDPVQQAVSDSTDSNQTAALNGPNSVGCNPAVHSWCLDLRQINVYVYYALMVSMIGLAFPLINVSMNTIFSKVIGPRMQAKQQGLMQMCGGMGRMLGPILIGLLYTLYGPQLVWAIECVVIVGTASLWAAFYRRLVPMEVPEELTAISTVSSGNNSPTMDSGGKGGGGKRNQRF